MTQRGNRTHPCCTARFWHFLQEMTPPGIPESRIRFPNLDPGLSTGLFFPDFPRKRPVDNPRIGVQESDSGFRKGHVCGNALWSFLCRVPLYVGTFIWQYNVRIHVPTYRTVALYYGCIPGTYWRSGAVFHAPGIPESRFPASRSWDCPQVSFLGVPGNSGQKSNDDDSHHRIPGCSQQWLQPALECKLRLL